MSRITEITGDLFASPPNSVLVHACNCKGTWGKGIAKRFRDLYPSAFAIYRIHCTSHLTCPTFTTLGTGTGTGTGTWRVQRPEGECFLIAPQDGDGRRHWIACLFTRWGYVGKGDPEMVLEATRGAVRDLGRQLGELRFPGGRGSVGVGERSVGGSSVGVGELFACRINSGCFGVGWEETRTVLEEVGLAMTVVSLGRDAGAPEPEERTRGRYRGRSVEAETRALEDGTLGKYVGFDASELRRKLEERGLWVGGGLSNHEIVALLVDDDEDRRRARYVGLSQDRLETEVALRGLFLPSDKRCKVQARHGALVGMLHKDDLEGGGESAPEASTEMVGLVQAKVETKGEGFHSEEQTRPLKATTDDPENEERFFSEFTRQLLKATRGDQEIDKGFFSIETRRLQKAPTDEHRRKDDENGAEARRFKRTRLG